MLSREEMLAFDDLTKHKVQVSAWNGKEIYVRSLPLEDHNRLSDCLKPENDDAIARLVILGVCDEQGKPVFTDADIPNLMKKSVHAMTQISREILKLNAIAVEEVAKAEATFPE